MGESNTLKTIIQVRRDTTANWEVSTYIPAVGEPCMDTDKKIIKWGDGEHLFTELLESGSSSAHYEVVVSAGQDDVAIINAYLTELDKTANKGDTATCKSLIAGTVEDGTAKYSYTGYVYDGTSWAAMDGNYSAENVYFPDDFTITQSVGNFETSNNTPISVPVTGKNIKQVFETLWATEDTELTIDTPSISLSLSSNASGEVGNTYTRPTATLKVDDTGSYEYGSKNDSGTKFEKNDGTNVTFSDLKVAMVSSSTGTVANSQRFNEVNDVAYITGQTLAYTATTDDITSNTYTDAKQSYYFRASATYTDSDRKPITNLDNFVKEDNTSTTVFAEGVGAISSATLDTGVKTWTATGWRNFWYGFVKTNITTDADEITNNITRNSSTNVVTWDDVTLIAGGKAITNGYLPGCSASAGLTSAVGDVAFVVLVPNSSNKQFDNITALGTINTSVPSDAYEKIANAVTINGYNGSTSVSYDILIYRPDEIPNGTKLTVKIK